MSTDTVQYITHIFTFTSAIVENCSLKQPEFSSKKMIQPVSHKIHVVVWCTLASYLLFAVWVSVTIVLILMSVGWPGAGPKQNSVNPHQCSRSISAHWVSHRPSLCEKDSVRLMGDWHVVKVLIGQAGVCFSCYLVMLFTNCSSSTGFHFWLMVIICREIPEKKIIIKKVKRVMAHLQRHNRKATRWMSKWVLQRTSANIIILTSPEQAGTNLITFLSQWLSNFCLQAGTSCLFFNGNKWNLVSYL